MVFEGVSLSKEKALKLRMEEAGILEADLEERFIQAQGPGGQNVNKVSSCVQLIHWPSGVRVRCQESRFQGMNRYRARWVLLRKVEDQRKQAEQKRIHDLQKRKRQTRKKPQSLKEQILKRKRIDSLKKTARRKIQTYKADD